MDMREAKFEMHACGLVGNPICCAGRKITQINKAKTIEHESSQKHQSCNNVYLSGGHDTFIWLGGLEFRRAIARHATKAMISQTAVRNVMANTVRIS